MRSLIAGLTLSLALAVTASVQATRDAAYEAEIEKWRQEQETALKADDGWLTVAGLFFLAEGENRFGSSPLNDIVLPADSAPAEAGVFEFHDGETAVRATPGTTLTVNGEPVEATALRTAGDGTPADTITLGGLTMFVHISGDRRAIRVRDRNSRIRKEFEGRRWFAVDEAYRVQGRFIPHGETQPLDVPNILGDTEHYTSSGLVAFTLVGQEHRMKAVDRRNGLWFIFRDLTSGQETYGAARFLRTDTPVDGKVILDFNKAYNPPCAFNPYTTCPLPPRENRLPVRVDAGELSYGDH